MSKFRYYYLNFLPNTILKINFYSKVLTSFKLKKTIKIKGV